MPEDKNPIKNPGYRLAERMKEALKQNDCGCCDSSGRCDMIKSVPKNPNASVGKNSRSNRENT